MSLASATEQAIRSQFHKLTDTDTDTRQSGVDAIRTAVRVFASTIPSFKKEAERAHGKDVLDRIVSELKDKYDVHISYQIGSHPPPLLPQIRNARIPQSEIAKAAINATFRTKAYKDIDELKTMPLGDPLRDNVVDRVRMIIKYLKENNVDTTELEGEFNDSFPRDKRGRTIDQVNSFFRKFGQPFSTTATQPQAEIPLDNIRDMLRRLEPSIAEIAATSVKPALKQSSKALESIVSSEPVRDTVRATRFTSFQIARSTRSEIVRLFMLLVNMFLTFKVAIVAAVYVFLMTTPVLAPNVVENTTVFDARAQSSLMTLASDEAKHSMGRVLNVLSKGVDANIWGQSDSVVLDWGKRELCSVLAEESGITREEELLINPTGGAFMSELGRVCTSESIWANEMAAVDFFRESMIGAGCVVYDPFASMLELSGHCSVPENSFVKAAVTTTNELKQSDDHLLMWVGASVLSITFILSEVGMGLSFGKNKKSKKNHKWSAKYKRSINCSKPKGFSQKQYCTYGRRR